MSTYCTLWVLRFPWFEDLCAGCEWVEVMGQGVAAHVGALQPAMDTKPVILTRVFSHHWCLMMPPVNKDIGHRATPTRTNAPRARSASRRPPCRWPFHTGP